MARPPIPFAQGAGSPVKLNLDIMDNIASGALLQFGALSVGDFSSKIVRWGNGTGALSRSLFYFVGEGKDAGTGRFSAGMAQHVKEWVQQALLFPSARKRNVAQGFHGPPRSLDYQKWVNAIGRGGQPTFYLMGTVASAFTVIKRTGGGTTLGIRESMKVRPPVPYHTPLTFQSFNVSVGDYAARVEYGGAGFPKRPVISGAIVGWLEKAQPEWAKLMREFLYDAYKVGRDKYAAMELPNPLDFAEKTQDERVAKLVGAWDTGYTHNVIATTPRTVEQFDKWTQDMSDYFAAGKGDTMPQSAVDLLIKRIQLVAQRIGQLDEKAVDRIWLAVLKGEEVETVLSGPARGGSR